MTKKQVLVVGFYDHGNLGDEAFKPAFQHLWGNKADFTFTDEIPFWTELEPYDALMIGGGSFLDQKAPINTDGMGVEHAVDAVDIPIGFIGIGYLPEALIHPSWKSLLIKSKIIVKRDSPPAFGEDVYYAPDLVFARPSLPSIRKDEKQLVVLGNDFLVPRRDSPRWKVDAWNWFEGEFSKTLDRYIDEGWGVRFVAMAGDQRGWKLATHDDRVFATRIISQMENRTEVFFGGVVSSVGNLTDAISSAGLVFTTRFHGCVFSTMFGTKFLAISHHDKIKNYMDDNSLFHRVNYYGLNSDRTWEMAESAVRDKDLLDDYKVIREEGYAAWQNMSGIVAEALSL